MNVDPKEMTKDEMVDLVSTKLTKLCEEIAIIIGTVSDNESNLLDGIRLAHEGIRSLACNVFVEKQKKKGKS